MEWSKEPINSKKHNITNNVSTQERKIIICRGTRSSGKTDWTKQWVLKDPEHRVRFSDDDIRNMLGKHQAPEREVLVNAMRRQFIVAALKKCYDVVIDGTLKPHENDFVRRCVKAHNSTVDELRSLGKLSPQDGTRYSIEYKDSIVPLQESTDEDATTATYKKTYKHIFFPYYTKYIISKDKYNRKENQGILVNKS